MVDEEPMNPALLMFVSSRYAETRILEHLAAEGFGDLTLAQARVAARIGPDGTRLTDLAEQAQVTKQSAGSLVDQLEKAGYVTREPDPTDARARLVSLAERGRRAQQAARETEHLIESEWEQHLGAAKMRQLRRALEDLREITDPWA
ncbi:MarR family transcriptional regulator [Nocardioides sp. Root151]|nr:MarR family transcriptional regulator [Nocardioides sp. Soil796]KQY55580.1 MarR family transcriptional regulator [Nocardioides sp. Root140]KQZ67237.1 MarR family transcriptional regulator [Nocardioides sp. Root151]KRF12683.1 MarR family transcriptional regulator [Nocardioides sp. Soil796]